jgi:hypothetical protein
MCSFNFFVVSLQNFVPPISVSNATYRHLPSTFVIVGGKWGVDPLLEEGNNRRMKERTKERKKRNKLV